MSLRWKTPCDYKDENGEYTCPYMSPDGQVNCEYWCGAGSDEDDVPEDDAIEYVYIGREFE